MTDERARLLIQAFAGSLKGLKLYPLQHPALARQIQSFLGVLETCQQGRSSLCIGLHDGALVVDDLLLAADMQAANDLVKLFQHLGLTGLQLDLGVSEEEISLLLTLLTTQSKGGG